ncbi:hypothetical protein H257_12120 [Aphanomyces astaci]|uniref:SUI1 domain-containing protein n=1 Tax=Aphanomyces astaci TaxID=112090 RepID=W4G0D5_APHAT|nr:hypothetical protein H257_12120 [Aphanomyces astaci]ETV72746.1 hypothetical protein H257_12120 [Aphanomyces astaci]|eukprot:XP_009837532.1 hypothetical protein H257_12120 [Aphanomyces astaci]
MFAKAFNTSGNTRLKGKDVKKVRLDLLKSCGIESDASFPWNLLAKAEIVKIKLAAPSRTVLFTDADSNVLAFDVHGKGDVVPSVYLLWHEPALRSHLPQLVVHSPVSHFLLRGADPMLPGVLKQSHSTDHPFLKGQLRAVYVHGNPMPFAIGDMLVDAETLAVQGWKGKAMQLLHVVFDELSKLNPQSLLSRNLPEGFTDNEILPIEVASQATASEVLDINAITLEGDEIEEKKPPSTVHVGPNEDDANDEEEGESVRSQADLDDLLERSFYQAMKVVKPSDAPMLASRFYASLVLPCRPVGTAINVKGTSYKKISTFLKDMASRGVVDVTEHDGVQTITLFRKTHPDVSRHQLHRSEMNVAVDLEAEATAGMFVPGKYAPEVVQLYRLTQQTQLLGADTKATALHLADVRALLNEYIATNGLVHPREPQYVQLDMILTDALYPGKKKPAAGYPDKLLRQDVLQLLVSRLRPYHSIQLYPEQPVVPVVGEYRPIRIKTELTKRQKPVTIVANIEQFGLDPDAFLKDAQKKWACSATIVLHGKDVEVHIQGNLGQDVVQYLGTQYKIASKLCSVEWGKGCQKPKK